MESNNTNSKNDSDKNGTPPNTNFLQIKNTNGVNLSMFVPQEYNDATNTIYFKSITSKELDLTSKSYISCKLKVAPLANLKAKPVENNHLCTRNPLKNVGQSVDIRNQRKSAKSQTVLKSPMKSISVRNDLVSLPNGNIKSLINGSVSPHVGSHETKSPKRSKLSFSPTKHSSPVKDNSTKESNVSRTSIRTLRSNSKPDFSFTNDFIETTLSPNVKKLLRESNSFLEQSETREVSIQSPPSRGNNLQNSWEKKELRTYSKVSKGKSLESSMVKETTSRSSPVFNTSQEITTAKSPRKRGRPTTNTPTKEIVHHNPVVKISRDDEGINCYPAVEFESSPKSPERKTRKKHHNKSDNNTKQKVSKVSLLEPCDTRGKITLFNEFMTESRKVKSINGFPSVEVEEKTVIFEEAESTKKRKNHRIKSNNSIPQKQRPNGSISKIISPVQEDDGKRKLRSFTEDLDNTSSAASSPTKSIKKQSTALCKLLSEKDSFLNKDTPSPNGLNKITDTTNMLIEMTKKRLRSTLKEISGNLDEINKPLTKRFEEESISEVSVRKSNRSIEVLEPEIEIIPDIKLEEIDENIIKIEDEAEPMDVSFSVEDNQIEIEAIVKSEESLADTSTDSSKIKEEIIDYEEGDLVWARIGQYPYWPCLIMKEPKSNKIVNYKQRNVFYNIAFFGDGRHAWAFRKNIMLYNDKDDLSQLVEKLKNVKKFKMLEKTGLVVKSFLLEKWTKAVEEAESVKPKTTEERLVYFKTPRQIPPKPSVTKDKPPKRQRKSLEIAQTKKSKFNDSVEKIIIVSDTSDCESQTSVSSMRPTLESQAELFRRNNLFKKVLKERVCQVCKVQGDILKCKGKCNGYYHEKCALLLNPSATSLTSESNLSLVEKIDLKMKEIMECTQQSMTIYPDDDDDDVLCLSPEQTAVISPPKRMLKHVTADSVTYDVATEKIKKKPPKETDNKIDDYNNTTFKCGFCTLNVSPPCFVCHKNVSKKLNEVRLKCSLYTCGRYYHEECLKLWPQTQWSLDSFVCPGHVCHTCVSDNPRQNTSRCEKVVKCLRCPATYHSTMYCLPAGSEILSSTQIMCPRHCEKTKKKPQFTINTTWCFVCSEGGNLICCETCPTSVHTECMPVNLTDDDTFICEDCESGRLPLYDEIVWVKLGNFKWWPALILFPNEIPEKVKKIKHNDGEFAVKFFGTYDHYWVSKCRAFLFQEGDKGQSNNKAGGKLDNPFNRAITEAAEAHRLKTEFKLSQETKIDMQKPPPYAKIRVNRPVGKVKQYDLNLSNTTSCECDPDEAHPCGPDSNCLNRLLLTECNPEVCPAGKRCNNQCFEKRDYPPLIPCKTKGRGWGLKTLAPIRKGQFVIEYVGELIDDKEYRRRVEMMHLKREENYYFLTIDKDRTIDAGPKGNVSRFMNHSCQPNCETQKWTVNGDTRVGLFSAEDIPANTELTFNYNLECIGEQKKECKCGAEKCSGFIGVKVKEEPVAPTKKYKKRRKSPPQVEVVNQLPCFVCNKNNEQVVSCSNKNCNRWYHLKCLNPVDYSENKFVCPWHNCNVCTKRTIRCCVRCLNSFCPQHSDGNIRFDKLIGFICKHHDPEITSNAIQVNNSNISSHETTCRVLVPDDDLPLIDLYWKRYSKNATDGNQSHETTCTVPVPDDDLPLIDLYWKRYSKSATDDDQSLSESNDIDCSITNANESKTQRSENPITSIENHDGEVRVTRRKSRQIEESQGKR